MMKRLTEICIYAMLFAAVLAGAAYAGRTDTSFNPAHLRAINRERESRGLPPLSMSRTMNRAAAIRAEELTRLFSHTRPDGTSCETALTQADSSFNWTYVGENASAGHSTVSAVVSAWMNSSGHRANILNGEFTRVGLATYVDNDERCYWIQMFTNNAPDSPYYGEDDGDNGGDGGYREDNGTGCSAGFGGLALAVLVMFAVYRK